MAPTRGNGKICYLEIPTADGARSVGFYRAGFRGAARRRGAGATAFDDGVGEARHAEEQRAGRQVLEEGSARDHYRYPGLLGWWPQLR